MKTFTVTLSLCVLTATSVSARAADELRVASKSFTESVILGEMVVLLAGSAGVPVDHRQALGGTRLCWDALLANALDVYPEYTGTLTQEILGGNLDAADASSLRNLLRARGIGLIGPLGFDNGYALAMHEPVAARLDVRTLSDLRRHPDLRLGFSNEFMNRKDGWIGLANRYQLSQAQAQGLDHDLAYRGLADGKIDVTDVYATDAEIRAYGLRVLVDDLRFFSRYDAVFLYRLDARERWPAAFAAFERLTGNIDAAAMIGMNARAKLDKIPERTVAADFLAARLGIRTLEKNKSDGSRAGSILRRTREHLALVGVSLAVAIVIALPLGIWSARRRRLGQVVLAIVGVVQTIPSLALLVFMIPLLGIGYLPAIVALLLYSLLPIVRNTHAGLVNIPAPLRESAQALGLSPAAILWRIELPLALGTILAGIKSAAVINVGTATLGALVGAGGFGQPIFTGIRLNDLPLILEGAVPASLVALAVQGIFDLFERWAVPRGLRLDGRE